MYGMVTKYEKQYLQDYARNKYSGVGEIVDLGCWMGATTVELAIGFQENPSSAIQARKIHAFDLFTWYPWMDKFVIGTPLEGKYQAGENFVNLFIENISPWKETIQVYPGDLTQQIWSAGAIEFLFIDAMKSWPLLNSIIHEFFPALIPGKSIIVQQDFTYFLTYWIQLIMYRFRDYFEPVYDVPYSPSFAFRYSREIPQNLLQEVYSKDTFSEAEINDAFHYASELVAVEKRPIIMAGKVVALLDKRGISPSESFAAGMSDLYKAQGKTLYLAQQVEQHKIQANSSQKDLKALRQKIKQKQKQLTQSHKTIELLQNEIQALQSSKFWKMRNLWFQFKNWMKFS